jgi:hypothetical protein
MSKAGSGILMIAEQGVAPDGGGITVVQDSTSHQPPQQVNFNVRKIIPHSPKLRQILAIQCPSPSPRREKVQLASCPLRFPLISLNLRRGGYKVPHPAADLCFR